DDDVRLFVRGRGDVAGVLEEAGEALGVVDVHLAPVGLDLVGARRGVRQCSHGAVKTTADQGAGVNSPSAARSAAARAQASTRSTCGTAPSQTVWPASSPQPARSAGRWMTRTRATSAARRRIHRNSPGGSGQTTRTSSLPALNA